MRTQQLGLAACLGLPLLAWAQPTAAPAPVTLASALQAARDNADVSIARRTLAGARADVAAADHAPAPVLSAKAGAIDLENGIGEGSVLRDKRIDKSIGLDWTWERGGKRQLRTRAAARAADAAAQDLADVIVQQQVAAAGAFYDLLAAQERVEQLAAIDRSVGELAAASQRRLRAGDISQQDGLRTDIEARRATADLRGAQAERVRAMLALAQLTGLAGELVAQAGWPQLPPELPALPDIERRPDVQAALQRVEAARAGLDGALALRRNDVTLGASIDHFPGTSRRLLELRLQMPLAGVLGSYGYEGEIAKARAALAQAEDQLDKTRRMAQAETARLIEDLRASAARAGEFDQAIVPRARQVAQMAELAWGKGALPLADLIDARRTLRNVLLDDLAARAEFARAHAAWQLRRAIATP